MINREIYDALKCLYEKVEQVHNELCDCYDEDDMRCNRLRDILEHLYNEKTFLDEEMDRCFKE